MEQDYCLEAPVISALQAMEQQQAQENPILPTTGVRNEAAGRDCGFDLTSQSRASVELKRRPIKRIVERAAAEQGKFGGAKSGIGTLSFLQRDVEFVHKLGGRDVTDLP
jgi:hypothetical protein